MRGPMRAVTLPSPDTAFRRVVESALASGSITKPSELEDWMRPLYPSTFVRARELSGETEPTWYVYRDGSFAPETAEEWWTGPDATVAWLAATTGKVVHGNEALAELVSAPVSEIEGDDYLNYVVPEARAGANVLFETALVFPELRSLVRLLRRDGETVTCEFKSLTTRDEVRIWFPRIGLVERS